MRILYLHQYFCPPGGSGNNRSLELGELLKEQGIEPVFFTSTAYFPTALQKEVSPNEVKHFTFRGIDVYASGVAYSHNMGFRQRIKAFLRFYRHASKACLNTFAKGDFDLIYASSTPPTVTELGKKLAAKWGIPFIFEAVDVWPDVPIGMGILKNKLLISWIHKRVNQQYAASSAIVALSEGMAEQVASHGIPESKIHILHNGTHPDRFPFVERPQRSPFRFIYTGTIGKANGLHHLLQAALWLQENASEDIRITIVGDGNDKERVQARARQLQLENVAFLDKVPKEAVAALLADADAGIVCFDDFAVLEANSANKFYDYAAAGLPVVLNYEGWQAEYLRRYPCGFTAPQGDDVAFASAMLRMAQSPHGDRLKMAAEGRKMVLENFDRRVIATRLAELMRSIAK